VEAGDRDSGLRLAELLAAFSLATDLGLGQPMEHVLRSWLIAGRLGDRLGLGAEARVSLYYVMMLAWVGCVADTAEVATWFGDDIAFRADSYRVDFAGLPMMGFALSHLPASQPEVCQQVSRSQPRAIGFGSRPRSREAPGPFSPASPRTAA
jgi:hypothetical protein